MESKRGKWSMWLALSASIGAPAGTKWAYITGTGHWDITAIKSGEVYYIAHDTDFLTPIAGPFDSESAVKAAYLLIGDLKNDNP